MSACVAAYLWRLKLVAVGNDGLPVGIFAPRPPSPTPLDATAPTTPTQPQAPRFRGASIDDISRIKTLNASDWKNVGKRFNHDIIVEASTSGFLTWVCSRRQSQPLGGDDGPAILFCCCANTILWTMAFERPRNYLLYNHIWGGRPGVFDVHRQKRRNLSLANT